MQDTGVLHTSHRLAEYERRIEKSKIIQKGEIKNKIKMHDCKIVAKMWIVSQLFFELLARSIGIYGSKILRLQRTFEDQLSSSIEVMCTTLIIISLR